MKLNEPLLISLALKALSITARGEEFVLAIIADEPMWRPLLNHLNPVWEPELVQDSKQGGRFFIGALDLGFVDYLVKIFPDGEAGIRALAPDGSVKVFALAFGGIDLFHVRYGSPDSSAGVS